MKKILFALLLIPGIVFAGVFDGNTWYNGEGYVTVSKHSPVKYMGQSYDHSISFVSPGGSENGSSDMCTVSGSNSVGCVGGAFSLSYNPSDNSVYLSDRFGPIGEYFAKK